MVLNGSCRRCKGPLDPIWDSEYCSLECMFDALNEDSAPISEHEHDYDFSEYIDDDPVFNANWPTLTPPVLPQVEE